MRGWAKTARPDFLRRIAAGLAPRGFVQVRPLLDGVEATFARWDGEAREVLDLAFNRDHLYATVVTSHAPIARLALRMLREAGREARNPQHPAASASGDLAVANWNAKPFLSTNVLYRWSFFEGLDLEQVATEVCNAFVAVGIPFFEQTSTPLGAHDFVRGPDYMGPQPTYVQMILALHVGDLAAVRDRVSKGPEGLLLDAEHIRVLQHWLDHGLPDTSAEAATLGWGPPGTPGSVERLVTPDGKTPSKKARKS